ncbi:MAG: DUF1287 domain-containing protein [Emergencia sp.]|nr:DUF1287 domain-containing protein [Emergencia sp.]
MSRRKYRVKRRFYVFAALFFAFILGIAAYVLFPQNQADSEPSKEAGQGFKITMAARAYISNDDLRYKDTYFAGGYPPDDIGVCTDVVWKAFQGIDVSIKDLVDADTYYYPEAYEDVRKLRDTNIDFRLVPQLERFFERNSKVLNCDVNSLLDWQAGDIVTFESSHVAIVSPFRNLWGRNYVIQHGKDPAAEEDRLFAADGMKVSGHFRWDENAVKKILWQWPIEEQEENINLYIERDN